MPLLENDSFSIGPNGPPKSWLRWPLDSLTWKIVVQILLPQIVFGYLQEIKLQE